MCKRKTIADCDSPCQNIASYFNIVDRATTLYGNKLIDRERSPFDLVLGSHGLNII